MFRRILIANRGEIAVRIIRTCSEMGIESVAVYSEVDKESLHVYLANKAICIGPADLSKSYLNMYAIITAAKVMEVDAIHPGYGMLSESADFALLCHKSGIKFIGPTPELLNMLGNKLNALEYVKMLNIPTIPNCSDTINDVDQGLQIAKEMGYPIMIKASSGGGGKGIRAVINDKEFMHNFHICKQEVKLCSNKEDLYIEKYIENARHIEVQILADTKGNVIHLGERDCTLQRKNQKIIEESPAVILEKQLRYKIINEAIKIAKECNYVNAGTIEFLVDNHKNYYFMEINPRLQVEHTVTEAICCIDIIKEQIRISEGQELSYSQDDIVINSFAMECRVNAEKPKSKFMPSIGRIEKLHFPAGNGVRIDSALYQNCDIAPLYDSNIAKVIVNGRSRVEVLRKMQRALSEFIITGIDTNIEFLIDILKQKEIYDCDYDTNFIERYMRDEKIE